MLIKLSTVSLSAGNFFWRVSFGILFVFCALNVFLVVGWRLLGCAEAYFLCCCKTPSMLL